MKKITPWILLAGVLIVIGVVSGRKNNAGGHTADAEAWSAYERGNLHLLSFQFTDAEENLRRAVALDPDFAMAHAALANLLYRTGRYGESVTEVALADSLADGVEADLERLEVQVRLSGFRVSEFHAQAESLLAAGTARDPDNLYFLVNAAHGAERTGDVQQVERMWNRVLEANANFASAHNQLGYLYLNQGRYADAESALRKYAFLAPELANPHDSLGELLMTVGRYTEAVEQFKLALTKQPDFFHSLINLALVYINQGRVEKGLRIIDEVLAELPSSEYTRKFLRQTANALFMHEMPHKAVVYGNQITEADSKSPSGTIYHAANLAVAARFDEAIAVMDSTLTAWREKSGYEKNPESIASIEASYHRVLGHISQVRGDHAAALASFEQALDVSRFMPPHAKLYDRLSLARSAHALGLLELARQQIEEIFKVNPLLAEPLVLAVRIALDQNDRTTAARYLDLLESLLVQADEDFPAAVEAELLRSQITLAD